MPNLSQQKNTLSLATWFSLATNQTCLMVAGWLNQTGLISPNETQRRQADNSPLCPPPLDGGRHGSPLVRHVVQPTLCVNGPLSHLWHLLCSVQWPRCDLTSLVGGLGSWIASAASGITGLIGVTDASVTTASFPSTHMSIQAAACAHTRPGVLRK